MRSYIIRRFLYMIVILFAVSIVAFIIIQLPPGDWTLSAGQTGLREAANDAEHAFQGVP